MEGFLRPVVQWLVGPVDPGPPIFPQLFRIPRVWKNTHSFSPLTPQAIFRDGLSWKKTSLFFNSWQPFKKLKVTKYTPSFRGRKPRHLPFKFQTSFGGLALWWSNVVTNLLSPCCGVFFKKATRSTANIPNLSGNTLLVWCFFSNSTTTSWHQ